MTTRAPHWLSPLFAVALRLRLLWHLSWFFSWFFIQLYLISRVLMLAFCWFLLTALLAASAWMQWHQPSPTLSQVNTPLFEKQLKQSPVHWRLFTIQLRKEYCEHLYSFTERFNTHRDVLINAALCAWIETKPTHAQRYWQMAKQQDPNHPLFQNSLGN